MNRYNIAIEIGGTQIRIASATGGNLHSDIKSFPFQKFNRLEEELVANIYQPIILFLEETKLSLNNLEAIGVSSAAIFNRGDGKIMLWPNNQKWSGLPLKSYLEYKFHVPVIIEDDANSAALGEARRGAGKGYNSFAYITISTGIGCGLFLNNELYLGKNGLAGELGHIKIHGIERKCGCGNSGCLQTIVSGTALFQYFIEKRKLEAEKYLEINSLKEIMCLADQKDELALDIIDRCSSYIGESLSNLILILDLPLIIIGGGVAKTGNILMQGIKSSVQDHLKYIPRNYEIKTAELGENSGIIGIASIMSSKNRD